MVGTLTKEYKALISRFPPRPIKDPTQKAAAVALMRELAMKGEKCSADEEDYLVLLGTLISSYERTQPEIQKLLADADKLTPEEVLAFFLEEHELTQTEIASELAIDQGNLSAFLSGKRGLSKTNATKLASRFKVSADLFLPKV